MRSSQARARPRETLSPTATNGLYSFDSTLNFNGTASFTYKVTDRGDPDNCGAVVVPTCTAALTSATEDGHDQRGPGQ